MSSDANSAGRLSGLAAALWPRFQALPLWVQPVFDDALYEANINRDGDRDGIACER